MSKGDVYIPTAEEHREHAMLLRRQVEYMSSVGRRRSIEIADEYDRLADSIERAPFH